MITENYQLKKFEKDYYKTEKERAILDERLKNIKPLNVMYDTCLATGTLIIGISLSISDMIQKVILIIIGIFLLLAVILNKKR